ncbi:MAG: universal stress protein [Planctomycetota bacterium]
MIYKTILVPVDLSENNDLAVQTAGSLGDPKKTQIKLLHVIETIQHITFEEIEAFYKKLQAHAEKILENWVKILKKKGFKVKIEIVYGKRGEEIVRFAEKNNVDLIILRSHRLDTTSSSESFGTLSHQVALFSQCSVLLVR